MGDDLSWAATVRLVRERAQNCCEYCQTCERIIGQSMHIDHINPNGSDDPDNLCLACPTCNLSKKATTHAVDPKTGETVALFHPRQQDWVTHFEWIDGGIRLRGITATGRATVECLRINQERMIIARTLWVRVGWHPPDRLT